MQQAGVPPNHGAPPPLRDAKGHRGGIHRNRETPKIELVHGCGEAISALVTPGNIAYLYVMQHLTTLLLLAGITLTAQAQTVDDYQPDSDGDGCVGMSDLLSLLSVFGSCETHAFACGDPVSYQGYDYATVLIGEQCWFAENLRSENYQNGDVIPASLPDSVWASTTEGAVAVYGEGDSPIIFGSSNEVQNLLIYGRMYNSFACADERNLCPLGWRVPSTSDFNDLTSWAQENSIDSLGVKLRHVDTWYFNNISTDEFGFGWKAGGNKVSGGAFNGQRLFGEMMVSDCPCWAELNYDWNIEYQVEGLYDGPQMAASVRCIKNDE